MMRWGSGFLRNDNWNTPLWKRGRFKPVLPPLPMRPLTPVQSESEEDRTEETAEKQSNPGMEMREAA